MSVYCFHIFLFLEHVILFSVCQFQSEDCWKHWVLWRNSRVTAKTNCCTEQAE